MQLKMLGPVVRLPDRLRIPAYAPTSQQIVICGSSTNTPSEKPSPQSNCTWFLARSCFQAALQYAVVLHIISSELETNTLDKKNASIMLRTEILAGWITALQYWTERAPLQKQTNLEQRRKSKIQVQYASQTTYTKHPSRTRKQHIYHEELHLIMNPRRPKTMPQELITRFFAHKLSTTISL